MASVNPYLVTKAVVALLREVLDVPVGHSQQPSGNPSAVEGFLVVNLIPPTIMMNDSYGVATGSMKKLRYQLTAVGLQGDQVELLAYAANLVLIDEDDNIYVHDIPIVGHEVFRREEAGVIPTDREDQAVNAGGYVDLSVQVTA